MRSHFRLENGNNLINCNSPGWVNPPTSLKRSPQTIRKLGVVGPSQATSLLHGIDHRVRVPAEGDFPSKCLMVKYSIQ